MQPGTTTQLSDAGSRGIGARAYLALAAAAALVPLLAAAGYVFYLMLQSDRATATARLLDAARAIAQAIDRELASTETLLRVLAASPHLAGDLASFQQQAAAVGAGDAVAIALYDAQGNALMHTDEPFGSVLEQHARPQQIAADLAGSEARTWIIERAQGRTPRVSLDIPWRAGDERYVVSQIRPAPYFATMLQQQKLPQGWTVTVFDGDLVGIAHSGGGRDFAGKPAPESIRRAVAENPDGGISNRNGAEVYEVFARAPRSGWLVAVSAPAQALGSDADEILGTAALGALAAVMVAAVVAFVLGHRLRGSIGDATVAASLLGRGQPLPPCRPSIKEIDNLCAALEEVHAGLERESEARARAEAERLQLFESEQSARQLAEQQNRAKDEFLAMLGHELRNPLSAISGAVALMKAPSAQEQHRQHAREVISRQVQHLSRVVDDLLDLSRVMTGKITLDLRPVDLAQVAASCLNSMRAAGRTGEHELKVALQPVWINGDPTRLEQIIGNLLSNAFKYTPPEGRIELEVSAEIDHAVLRVRDTGLGIPKRLLPHVFDVFVQGDQSLERAKGGLGIGLALVQRLVRLHGGNVHADSGGDGRGSTFSVRLPRITAPDAGANSAAAGAPARRRLRVLVVDDHEDSRTMLRMLLEQAGHEAVEAVDGIDGVQIALSRRPDVAIVDIGLPGINGYEVARRLRQLPVSGTMALIALTGYGQDEDRRRALQSGFDRHLVKPVDAERLTQALLEVTAAAVVPAAPHSAPPA